MAEFTPPEDDILSPEQSFTPPEGDILASDTAQFPLGFERGIYETGISLGSGLQILGNVPGLGFVHGLGESLETSAKAELDQLPLPNESDVVGLWNRLESGEAGADEALDWFAYTLGNAGPAMAASVAAGTIGTVAAGPAAGLAGMAGVSYLLNSGEVYANLREQGFDNPGAAAAAGIPMALLDIVTPGRLFGKVIWRPSQLVRDTGVKGIGQSIRGTGREVLKSFTSEALTETAQEAIGAGTESLVSGRDFMTPETMSRLLNAFAAGGIAGGTLGGSVQAYREASTSRVKPLNQGPNLAENPEVARNEEFVEEELPPLVPIEVMEELDGDLVPMELKEPKKQVTIIPYTRAPDAAKQIEVARQTAPENSTIVLNEPESGYRYEKDTTSNAYKIEAINAQEVAENMGHILADKWLTVLTQEPKQREKLEQKFTEQTQTMGNEAPTFGQWLIAQSSIEPELNKLHLALREHHVTAGIIKPYEDWVVDLLDHTRIEMSGKHDVPEPGRLTSEAKDTSQSLFNILDGVKGISSDLDGMDAGERDALQTTLDKSSWFSRNFLTLPQFAEQNKHISTLTEYMDGVRDFWADKTAFTSLATERLNTWMKFGSEVQPNITRYLLEQTILSDQRKRRLNPDERRALARKYKLDTDAQEFVLSVEQDMQQVLAAIKEQMLLEAEERLNKDGDTKTSAALKVQIEEDYQHLEQRNYFPMSRFGKHTIIVTAKHALTFADKKYTKGDTVARYQYDRATERSKDLVKVRARFAKDRYAIAEGVVEDTEFAFQGFPPSLAKSLESELGLNEEQQRSLQQAFIRLAPGAGFMKHRLERQGIAGFSEDGIRVYADYMFHASNHYARLRHYRGLADNINTIKDQIRQIINNGGNYSKRQRIRQYMNEHYRYLMNPSNEAAGVRSFIFKWYFLGNARQLLVNLTQVPLFTYSYLAAQYGDVKTGAILGKTYTDVFKSLNNPTVYTEQESEFIRRGIQAGFLNEGLAVEVAAQAHGDVLSRMRGSSAFSRLAQRLTNMGLFPFKWSENINRRVSFIAAIRLAEQSGITDPEALFVSGRDVVEKTQFEYARWARMPIARGGRTLGAAAPVLFLFQSFTQGALYFYATQPGRGRAMVAMLLAAGLMGLPGAEDVADVIDWLVTKMGEKFGWKDPHFEARKWIRDTLTAVNVHPDLVMHGGSRYTFGLYGLNLLFGLPVPAVDLSTSISMGRVIPGVESLFSTTARPRERVSRAVESLGGVAGSLAVSWSRALFSDDVHDWYRAMPPAIRNVSMAIKAASEQGYTDRSGAKLVPLDPYDNEHSAELIALGLLGSRPTRLAQVQERNWAQTESKYYYMIRRELVMKDLAFATIAKDKKAKADALKALRIYNAAAPPGLRISTKDMMRSLKSRVKNRRLREMGLPPEKRFLPLYRGFEPGFPTLD